MQLTRLPATWEGAPDKARPLVAWWGWQLEDTLRRNDHKPCWRSYRTAWPLVVKLFEEVGELLVEVVWHRRPARVIAEAADVAAVAMMLADWSADASGDRGRDEVW